MELGFVKPKRKPAYFFTYSDFGKVQPFASLPYKRIALFTNRREGNKTHHMFMKNKIKSFSN